MSWTFESEDFSQEDDDEEIFEIFDYSLASKFEKFVAQLEEVLGEMFTAGSKATMQEKKIPYLSHMLKVVYYRDESSGKDDQSVLSRILDSNLDFPSKGQILHTWFGLRTFVLVTSSAENDQISESEASAILSGVGIVLIRNLRKKKIPFFVSVGRIRDANYLGRCYTQQNKIIKFKSESLKQIPTYYNYICGLVDLFSMNLQHRLARTTQLSSTLAAPEIALSSQFHYTIPSKNFSWKKILRILNQKNISKSLLRWGCLRDPLERLRLSCTWKSFPESELKNVEEKLVPTTEIGWRLEVKLTDAIFSPTKDGNNEKIVPTRTLPNGKKKKKIKQQIQEYVEQSLLFRKRGKRYQAELTNFLRYFCDLYKQVLVLEQKKLLERSNSANSPGKKKKKTKKKKKKKKKKESGDEKESAFLVDEIAGLDNDFLLEEEGEDGESSDESEEEEEKPEEKKKKKKIAEKNKKKKKKNVMYDINEIRKALKQIFEEDAIEILEEKKSEPKKPIYTMKRSFPVGSLLSLLVIQSSMLDNVEEIRVLWKEFVQKLRLEYWDRRNQIPKLSSFTKDGKPDWGSSLLFQKLVMLNCCIDGLIEVSERKNRKEKAEEERKKKEKEKRQADEKRELLKKELLEKKSEKGEAEEGGEDDDEEDSGSSGSDEDDDDEFFDVEDDNEEKKDEEKDVSTTTEKDKSGIRVGVLRELGDGAVLELTGEPIYIPETKETPPMTQDMIQNQQVLLSSLGNDEKASEIRAMRQSRSLYSDMQSFKAANPGCSFLDFVRWYSPADIVKGNLSGRMMKENNLWTRLWRKAKGVACVEQEDTFLDWEKEGELALKYLEETGMESVMREMLMNLYVVAYYTLEGVVGDELGGGGSDRGVCMVLGELRRKLEGLVHVEKPSLERLEELNYVFEGLEVLVSKGVSFMDKFEVKNNKKERMGDVMHKFLNSIVEQYNMTSKKGLWEEGESVVKFDGRTFTIELDKESRSRKEELIKCIIHHKQQESKELYVKRKKKREKEKKKEKEKEKEKGKEDEEEGEKKSKVDDEEAKKKKWMEERIREIEPEKREYVLREVKNGHRMYICFQKKKLLKIASAFVERFPF